MSYKIEEIEGIGTANRDKLAQAKITTTDDLLELCCNPKGRKEIAGKTSIGEGQLLKWANMADLMRVSGIGKQYAELLEASGVDTIKELRNRRSDNLVTKLSEINDSRQLAKSTPTPTMVQEWIDKAQAMEPKISH